jgi:hypothetical protein
VNLSVADSMLNQCRLLGSSHELEPSLVDVSFDCVVTGLVKFRMNLSEIKVDFFAKLLSCFV